MPNFITSPNMSLPVPVVGTDPGPDWANNLNASLAIIDSHSHAAGSGVQINPSGINITTDLPYNSNNAISLRSARFSPQSILVGAADLDCLFVNGVDLYYNDGAGNHVRITQSGGVAGSPGSIGGLSSPASANYSSGPGTFIWQSAANTAANMDMASIIIRDQVAASNGITINAPVSLAANYSLTLPASLPGATSFMTLSSSGNIASGPSVAAGITNANIANQTITQVLLASRATGTTVAAGGVAVSGSSGAFATSSASPVNVTNLSVTITTTGRPVWVFLQAFGGAAVPPNPTATFYVQTTVGGTTSPRGAATILNGATVIHCSSLQTTSTVINSAIAIPSTAINTIDMSVNGVPGTYTYQVQLQVETSNTIAQIINSLLVAYEI